MTEAHVEGLYDDDVDNEAYEAYQPLPPPPVKEEYVPTKDDCSGYTFPTPPDGRHEECARWIGLEAAIQESQKALPPPSSPTLENLPRPRPFFP
jgi:hypothetical protein